MRIAGVGALGFAWMLVVLVAGMARAGGLYLNEFSTPSMGTAGAGAPALANDASTAFHNAAGMTRIQGHQLMMGAGFVAGRIKFDPDSRTTVAGNDGGNQSNAAPIVGSYYVHDLAERWRLGLSLNAISAASLDPRSGWVGRFMVNEVTMSVIELTPTFAYRVNDRLSIGGGPRFGWAQLDQKIQLPLGMFGEGEVELDDLDDYTVGFTAGALFELSTRTRLGINYSSELELEFSGKSRFRPSGLSGDVDAEFELAQSIRLGLYHEFNDAWSVVAGLGWEDWSAFDAIDVTTGPVSVSLSQDWDDTYYASLGARWRPLPDWTLTAGMAYDSSPTKANRRTADLPVDRQLRYALGVLYQWSETTTVGASFVYADYGKAKIHSRGAAGDVFGEYDSNDLFFLTFHVNWSKLPWSGRWTRYDSGT